MCAYCSLRLLRWCCKSCVAGLTDGFLSMRCFHESVFLFTAQCSSPGEAVAFNALFLWEHSLFCAWGAARQWAARGKNSLVWVFTFHDGCKQEIDQQIFNRKSISRKITPPQSLFKEILREIDFVLKICWSIPCLHPSCKVHTWIEICASLNHRKKTKADGSRLIPRKHTETPVLLSEATRQFHRRISVVRPAATI